MTEEVLSVSQIQRKSANAVVREFRGAVWVAGEIKNMRDSRGNWYLTLVEPGDQHQGGDISLDVFAYAKRKLVIQAHLDRLGIQLAAGMEVRIKGAVKLSKFGKLTLEMFELDSEALLGKQQAEKRLLLQAIAAEGIADRNRRLSLALVPLRVGLVASEGSDGYDDFLGQLQRSGYAFSVRFVHSPVQGPTAPALLKRAIQSFESSDVDVIAVVRGGGGELDAFDKEPVVRAVALAPVPVWLGVGHTGDQSISDKVAHRSFITPTECGQALVGVIRDIDSRLQTSATRLQRMCSLQLDRANSQLSSMTRVLSVTALNQVDRAHNGLRRQLDHLHRHSDRDLALAGAHMNELRSSLARAASNSLDRQSATVLDGVRQTLRSMRHAIERQNDQVRMLQVRAQAFDPASALRRGYSLTYDANGKLIRSITDVEPGERLHTQLSNGRLVSTVDSPEETS